MKIVAFYPCFFFRIFRECGNCRKSTMIRIRKVVWQEIARPLRVRFATAQGHKDMMNSVVVTITLDNGATGFGECVTSLSLKAESIRVVKDFLATVTPGLHGVPIADCESFIAELRKRYPHHPMTISGVEVALFRAYLASMGKTEHDYWGGRKTTLETDITIPITDDVDFIRRWLRYCFRKGFSAFKLKVRGDVERDKEMLSIVYRELSDNLKDFTVRLDGNQGFSVKTYAQFTEAIRKAGYAIELFEQPLPKDDVKGQKVVKLFSPFPIILDETVVTALDVTRAIEEDLAHGVNIKIAKSGILESAAILAIAEKQDLKLMIGCMTETMTGLSAAINLAAGTGAFDYVDLDSIFLLYHKNKFENISLHGPCFVLQP